MIEVRQRVPEKGPSEQTQLHLELTGFSLVSEPNNPYAPAMEVVALISLMSLYCCGCDREIKEEYLTFTKISSLHGSSELRGLCPDCLAKVDSGKEFIHVHDEELCGRRMKFFLQRHPTKKPDCSDPPPPAIGNLPPGLYDDEIAKLDKVKRPTSSTEAA